MNTQAFVSLLQWHFSVFPFHVKVNSEQTLHFFHDAKKGLWHSFNYLLWRYIEPGYTPQGLSKSFWGKRQWNNPPQNPHIVQRLAERIWFYVVKWLCFGGTTKQKQPEDKTAFETQWLSKHSSEKQGKRTLPTLYLDATIFVLSFKIIVFKI